MLNSVVKISMMSAKYFEYYTTMLYREAVFSWTRCITNLAIANKSCVSSSAALQLDEKFHVKTFATNMQ